MDKEAWWVTVQRVEKSMTEHAHMQNDNLLFSSVPLYSKFRVNRKHTISPSNISFRYNVAQYKEM